MGCTFSYMLDASIINEPKVQNKPKLGMTLLRTMKSSGCQFNQWKSAHSHKVKNINVSRAKNKGPGSNFSTYNGTTQSNTRGKNKEKSFQGYKKLHFSKLLSTKSRRHPKKNKIKLTTIRMTIKYKLYKVYSKQNQQILKHN
jgi:hypothetical protein